MVFQILTLEVILKQDERIADQTKRGETDLKVLLAETAGFCKGVRRAINMVLERSEQESGGMFTDGPLIHNPQTIEMLHQRGIGVLDKSKAARSGDTVVIRSHGVPPGRREELRAMGATICDATCPDVARIQGIIRRHVRKGYLALIVGDKNHAEVIGLEGYAEGRGVVISSPEEVKDLPGDGRVCVVAQSTLYPETLKAVAAEVLKRWPEAVVIDTICPSTYHRQEELQRLARDAEAVVVVGGKNSANTRRLAQISESLGTPTFLVETAEEIDPSEFERFRTVGVTAGASTPNWIIMQAVDKLRGIDYRSSSPLSRLTRRTFRFIIKSDLLIASGAAFLCYANAILMGIELGWTPYAVAFCYILSAHLLTHFTSSGDFERTTGHAPDDRQAHERYYLALAVSAAAAAIGLAAMKGVVPLLIMLGLIVLAALYRLDVVPLDIRLGGRKYSLRLVPASKDINMSLGWAVVTVFFPLFMTGHEILNPTFFFAFAYTFMIVLSRSIFFDLRDMQGDRIVGRETLPIILGGKATRGVLTSLLALQAVVLTAGSGLGWLTPFGWAMLLVTGYICLYLYLFRSGRIRRTIPVEVTGDAQFILAGALAFIYHLAVG